MKLKSKSSFTQKKKYKHRATSTVLKEVSLEEAPGRHDQPAEGGRAIVEQALAAASEAPEKRQRKMAA